MFLWKQVCKYFADMFFIPSHSESELLVASWDTSPVIPEASSHFTGSLRPMTCHIFRKTGTLFTSPPKEAHCRSLSDGFSFACHSHFNFWQVIKCLHFYLIICQIGHSSCLRDLTEYIIITTTTATTPHYDYCLVMF